MLSLRPTCENCNKELPPDSTEAMICSYECTYCNACVNDLLNNVCPNCGGGFCNRPIRPSKNLKNNAYLGRDPASREIIHNPIDSESHAVFASNISAIPANER